MAFPRRLLLEGEELIFDLRPHWIALVGPVAATLVVIVVWIVVPGRLPAGSAHKALVLALLAAGVLVLLWYPAREAIRWATSHFVVTSDRVIHRQGLIAKSSMEIPLEKINDVRFHQGIFERMIGAGDLIIESAGEAGRQAFSEIRHPEQVQKTIYEQGERNQARPQRPLASGAHSSTTELERLADLHERGVLTDEEFEAQKKKILGRG